MLLLQRPVEEDCRRDAGEDPKKAEDAERRRARASETACGDFHRVVAGRTSEREGGQQRQEGTSMQGEAARTWARTWRAARRGLVGAAQIRQRVDVELDEGGRAMWPESLLRKGPDGVGRAKRISSSWLRERVSRVRARAVSAAAAAGSLMARAAGQAQTLFPAGGERASTRPATTT